MSEAALTGAPSWRAYLAHLRPATFLPTFVMGVPGVVLSDPMPRGPALLETLLLLFVILSVLLWGGTNAFNSAEDGDAGALNLLREPPAIPPYLGATGLALKAMAVALAARVGAWPALLVGAAALLSVVYSWRGAPWRRWKEIGGADLGLYALGCGAGSVLLGNALTSGPLNVAIVVAAVGFTISIAGGSPTSQLFQLDESDDYASAPGWCTLVGPARMLRLGAVLFAAHLALFIVGAAMVDALRPDNALQWLAFAGWAGLVAGSAVHSWRWSRAPHDAAYDKMTRQMAAMLASQALWTLSVA